jgi:hypothetical protein
MSSPVLPEYEINMITSFCFTLATVSARLETPPARKALYLSDVPEVAMDGLSGMHEGAAYPQALHSRDHLLPHQPALAYTADDEFAASLVNASDQLDGLEQTLSGYGVGSIQDADLRERGCGSGKNIDGARQQTRPLGRARTVGKWRRQGLRQGLRLRTGAFSLL